MEWFDPAIKLPEVSKGQNGCRCLAFCHHLMDDESSWSGFVDVYFNPSIGWQRCEIQVKLPVRIIKWTYWNEWYNEK